MKVQHSITRRPRIEMLPLIDIVFLLLVFFIYAMLSMAVHRGLSVSLPASSTASMDKTLLLSVTLRADGSLYLDKERILLAHLSEALKRKTGDDKKAGVLLFADKDLPYQKLFNVLDQIRLAGLNRISLQAEAESADEPF